VQDGYGAVFRAVVVKSAIAPLARLLALLGLLALPAPAADLDEFVVEFRETSNHDALLSFPTASSQRFQDAHTPRLDQESLVFTMNLKGSGGERVPISLLLFIPA
jgi:hypothetical protein